MARQKTTAAVRKKPGSPPKKRGRQRKNPKDALKRYDPKKRSKSNMPDDSWYDPERALSDPKLEAYAMAVASETKTSHRECYQQIFPKVRKSVLQVAANQAKQLVYDRIEAIREQIARQAILSASDAAIKLTNMIRPTLMDFVRVDADENKVYVEIDHDDPSNSALKRIRTRPDGSIELEMIDQTRAIQALARMMGYEGAQKVEVNVLDEIARDITEDNGSIMDVAEVGAGTTLALESHNEIEEDLYGDEDL